MFESKSGYSVVLSVPVGWLALVLTVNFLNLSVQEVFQIGTYLSIKFWVVWIASSLLVSIIIIIPVIIIVGIILLLLAIFS